MSLEAAQVRLKDQLYLSALQHFQTGEWDVGLAELARLVERFPLDHTLRTFSQEMQLRANIDRDEREDRRRGGQGKAVRAATWLAAGVLVVGLVTYGAQTYSTLAREQVTLALQSLEQQRQVVELAAKFTNAQALLRGGRSDEALTLLLEVQAAQPDFPGLEASLSQAEGAVSLEGQYAEVLGLIEQQDWNAAQAVLQDILGQDPNYRDVSQRIAQVEKQYLLLDMMAHADEQFGAEDWVASVSAYESVRALDLEFQAELVEDRLFNSYVNSARQALVGQADSLDALRTAEGYYRKALALRPQDPEVKTERELAGLYLKAQSDFNRGQWTDVITALELVILQDSAYANGTARQTLYEAYVARGQAESSGSEYEAALADFQRAIDVLETTEKTSLALLEATLRLSEVQDALANYEASALLYRTVVELSGLREQALEDPPLAAALAQADSDLVEGKFSLALEGYRESLRLANESREPATLTHVVQPGEYLTLIAGRYGSTVSAIVEANEIQNPNLIYPAQELIIPVLP